MQARAAARPARPTLPLPLLLAAAALQVAGAFQATASRGVARSAAPSAKNATAADGASLSAAHQAPLMEWLTHESALVANGSRGLADVLNDTEDTIAWEVEAILNVSGDRPYGRRWGPPVWWQPKHNPKSAKELWQDFWTIPDHKLIGLVVAGIGLLALDKYVVQERIQRSALQPLFWVTLAGIFNLVVLTTYTPTDAVEWLTGYTYEWVFQVDNLLVCHIIFKRYKVPRRLRARALWVVLCGQLLIRMLFYLGLAHIVHRVQAPRYIAGLLLIYGGYHTIRDPKGGMGEAVDEEAPQAMITVIGQWLLERFGRHAPGGDWKFLAPAVASMLLVDLVLGADCAIAKIEALPTAYWNLTSSGLALFALKACYALLADLAEKLAYLQYGIGAVLVFIGAELLLMSWVDIGSFTSISVCVGLMATCAFTSLLCGPPGLGGARDLLVPPRKDVPREVSEDEFSEASSKDLSARGSPQRVS